MSRSTITVPPSRLSRLLDATAEATGQPSGAIIGRRRTVSVTWARFAYVWAAHTGLRASTREIGVVLGDRDHSTILNAVQRATALRDEDTDFRAVTDRLVTLAREARRG